MLRHVLVPLDGSPLAEKALDAARRILAADGKITLLTCVQKPSPPLYAYPSPEAFAEITEEVEVIRSGEQHATQYLERVASNLKLQGVMTDVEVGAGDPAELIIQRATVLGVEAIVMSTHGRSGLSRLLFGSVTLKVLSDTPCPVFVVPNRAQERVEDPKPLSDIGTDMLPAQ